MSVHIVTDSACDIDREDAERLGITIIPLRVLFGEEEYRDGVTLTHADFFAKMATTKELPTTSQIPPYEYEQCFEELQGEDDSIVCITLSSKLSGCFQNAQLAAQSRKGIQVVDSENACVGQRLLVLRAVELRKEGKSAEEIAAILNEEKGDIRLIALLDTLEYLKKGGRISPAEAVVGGLLSIKPVAAIEHGAAKVLGKARGSKRGNNLLMEFVEKAGGIRFDRPYCLAYSGGSRSVLEQYIRDSKQLYEQHVELEQLPVSSIGCAIGTHVGPGAIAVAFYARKSI